MGKKGFDSKLIDDKGELCKMTDTHIIKSCCKKINDCRKNVFFSYFVEIANDPVCIYMIDKKAS